MWAGPSCAAGYDVGDGRTTRGRTRRTAASGRGEQAGPGAGEFGEGLRRGRDVIHRDAGDGEAEDDGRVRHPVVVVGAERAAVQRGRPDGQAVAGLRDVPAEGVELG